MADPLPLPDDIEQEIYSRSRYFVPEAVQRAIEEMMRAYGAAAERATAQRCRELCEMEAALSGSLNKSMGANQCSAVIAREFNL